MHILSMDDTPAPIIWNGYLRAGYATWPVGQTCPVHYHQRAAEVFIFLDGECDFVVDGETQRVRAGQTVYVGPGASHKLTAVGDRPMKMFLAVLPNHEPTHTIQQDDGTWRDHNRQPPGPTDVWIGKGD